ncbi:MAG: transcriptional repressor LexA [Phycisphaera sp.]|nr:transcriptional repressor LexA [Phycisphaera sp.]
MWGFAFTTTPRETQPETPSWQTRFSCSAQAATTRTLTTHVAPRSSKRPIPPSAIRATANPPAALRCGHACVVVGKTSPRTRSRPQPTSIRLRPIPTSTSPTLCPRVSTTRPATSPRPHPTPTSRPKRCSRRASSSACRRLPCRTPQRFTPHPNPLTTRYTMSPPLNPNLTPKQLDILMRIREMRLTRGYSPTMQELADELGVSKVTVFEHVEALIRKGALLRDKNKARSLEINPAFKLPSEERSSRLPLVGAIAAGFPIEAVEDQQTLDLEDLFAPRSSRKTNFVLKVRGDSMIEEQIRDGDYVVIERRDTAYNGQTVVALLDTGEATLKKFYKEKGRYRLQPANPAYEPLFVKPDECQIQGIVVGVIRTY